MPQHGILLVHLVVTSHVASCTLGTACLNVRELEGKHKKKFDVDDIVRGQREDSSATLVELMTVRFRRTTEEPFGRGSEGKCL